MSERGEYSDQIRCGFNDPCPACGLHRDADGEPMHEPWCTGKVCACGDAPDCRTCWPAAKETP